MKGMEFRLINTGMKILVNTDRIDAVVQEHGYDDAAVIYIGDNEFLVDMAYDAIVGHFPVY